MENKVVYANAYTVHVSNQEVLIDFKMVTPERKDPMIPETLVIRVVQTIKSGEALNLILSKTLQQHKDKENGAGGRF